MRVRLRSRMNIGTATRRVIMGAGLVCLLPCLTGCQSLRDCTVTGYLWDENTLNSHYQPSTNVSNIRLFQKAGGGDVLVQYDEEREKDGAIKRRAYFLNANQARVDAVKKPRFVKVESANGLEPIPLVWETSAASNTTAKVTATISADGRGFTLSRDGAEPYSYRLPTYPDGATKVKRVLLTPATVTADAAIWATIVGLIGAYIYAAGQCH